MRSKWRTALFIGVSGLSVIGGAALSAPAVAQEADDSEIVVTARRTEESLQEVPASVSAFSESTLEQIGAADPTGIQGAVPNLNIVQGRGSSNATNIYIRGIGQPDALQSFDPAVGFYVDDVFYSRIRGTQLEMFDIERVEVLRGPQGTLYGRNTIGGAFKVVTRRPDQTPRGLFQVTGGDYGQLEGRLSLSGPLSDTFAAGVSLFGATRDGYVTNPVTGEEYNDRNVVAGRVQLAWTPSDNFRLDFSYDVADEDNALVMGQPTSTLTTILGVPLFVVPNPVPEYDFTGAPTPGLPNSTQMTHDGYALSATWDVSEALTLRSITALRNLENNDYVDIDATTLELGDVFVGVDQEQFTQEFQLLFDGGNWNFVGGVFYLDENIVSHQEAYADDFLGAAFGNATFLRTIDDELDTQSWAVFANVTYDITEQLSVSGGLRYTEEEKTYDRSTSTFSSNPLFTANPAFAFSGLTNTWDDLSGMVSVDFQATDDILLYGRVAQGFKSGGFNGRANNPGEQAPYDPETVVSYEIGAKTDWMDNTLRANAAVFYNDYSDFQARVSNLTTDPGTGLPSVELTVLNAGGLDIYGAELELLFTPVEALTLDAQIGYLHAEYTEFEDLRFTSFGGSRAFQEPAFSPEWTSRFGAGYEFDLADAGSLRLGAAARFRSRMALAVDNTPTNSNVELPGMFQDDYWLFDANLIWTSADGVLSAGLYGRNLSDEVYRTDGQEFSSVGGIRTVYYGAPQTWSVVLTARY